MTARNRSKMGETQRSDWIIPASATTNNAALTADSAKAAVIAKPETDVSAGRFMFADVELIDRVLIELGFVLTDAANETATANVWSWTRSPAGTWIAKLLCTLTATAGTRTGIAGGEFGSADLFADTIAASVDRTPRTVGISASADGIATIEIDHRGSEVIEVECSRGSSSASVKPFMRGL